ncbi:hypothetical protein IscW_ISCW013379 [Ixodes scapularis]|uniref:Uncharacterized protein n=1 Tax=Ixodes scapularis TaxID=6945 RepID=B7QCC5_IXOSC|nr:hypothetical protein IscW_ISCW013379 [Ixodes scapularis]|eukprot:XP_002413189.1 hypothetical protein IscW_ISCW013379 [Ixodes scapularis]
MLNRCAMLFGLKHSNEDLPWAFCVLCFAVASKCFPVCLLLLPGVPQSSCPVSRPQIFFFLRWKCGLHVVGDIVMWVPLAHVGHSTCAFFVHFNRVKTLLVALLVLY